MNRLENMETFVRVVEAGGISAAADKLNVAKSAVSRRLKELESHIGVELLHRTTRKMNLTDTGQVYYQDCLRILDEILESDLKASLAHGNLKGSLKIALPSSFGLTHIGPAINDFLLAHPQIEFDLDFNDREVDLMKEGFDLAIRIAQLADSSLIARRIAPIRSVICTSPAYLERAGAMLSPDDLSRQQCLVYSLLRDYDYWQLIDPAGKKIKIKVQPYLKSSSGEYLIKAAVEGHGIILVPTFIAHREIENGSLVTLFSDYRFPQLNAYAIYPQTRHLSQRVRTFVDFLAERFNGTPHWDEFLSHS